MTRLKIRKKYKPGKERKTHNKTWSQITREVSELLTTNNSFYNKNYIN